MVIVFKHFTFLFARSYNQNRANVYNLFIYNILTRSATILIVHISYIPVYDFLKLSKFHTSQVPATELTKDLVAYLKI